MISAVKVANYVPPTLEPFTLNMDEAQVQGTVIGVHLRSIGDENKFKKEMGAFLRLMRSHSLEQIVSAFENLRATKIKGVKQLHLPLVFLASAAAAELFKTKTAPAIEIENYVGNERAIIEFVSMLSHQRDGDSSGCIQLKNLAQTLGMSLNTMKVTLGRLQKKGVIETVRKKQGRGGWADYRVRPDLASQLKRCEANQKQTSISKLVQKYNTLTNDIATPVVVESTRHVLTP